MLQRFLDSNACCHDLSTDQLVVTAGSNQLLHLVSESLLDPGDIVLCAAPTYLVFLGTLSNVGARSVGVAIDQFGMIPEALERSLKWLHGRGELKRVKAIYLVPYFDNPCGITMPLERRAASWRLPNAGRSGTRSTSSRMKPTVICGTKETMSPSTLTVDDEGDTVIVTGTFSKSFSPGIRVGWGILPRHLIGPVCSQKGNIDFGSPNFSQHLMANVLRPGSLRTTPRKDSAELSDETGSHAGSLAESLRLRRRRALGQAHRWPVRLGATAGRHLRGTGWPVIRHRAAGGRAIRSRGVLLPGIGRADSAEHLALSFGVQSPEKISQGVAALARAIRQVAACKV